MPTYEYECGGCGHRFEKFQNMTDSPIRKCPQCNKNRAKRLIGAGSGIIFKGSGFYATDYRKSKSSGKDSDQKSCPAAKKDSPGCANCPASKQ